MFEGIERSYCDAMLCALQDANDALLETSVDEATSKSYVWRKGDTMGLDQRPENAIARSLGEFDSRAIIISEEIGEYSNPLANGGMDTVSGARTFYGCDPFDRSNQACAFIKANAQPSQRVADLILKNPDAVKLWEAKYGRPAGITGASAAITCVRRGIPIGTVMLNYLTQRIFLACRAGFFFADLPSDTTALLNTEYLMTQGKRIEFPPIAREFSSRIVTFIGKPERGYPKNFSAINLVNDEELTNCLHYGECGGPLRILYLSSLQAADEAVGVVVANGEKFGEWIHWLTFSSFARRPDDPSAPALRIFEVAQDQSFMRDGYLMMPSPVYSVFKNRNPRQVLFNVEMLRALDNPSRYRATLVVVNAANKWAISRIEQYGYREIVF